MRIGIDLGGTKIEVIALADDGRGCFAIASPRRAMTMGKPLAAIAGLVKLAEDHTMNWDRSGSAFPARCRRLPGG